MFEGKVVWFNAKYGYGFIEWSDNGVKQKDMFCHFSDIICKGYKAVNKNDKVKFEIGKTNDGKPKAVNITVIS